MVKDRRAREKGILWQRPALKTRKGITPQPTEIDFLAEKYQIATVMAIVKRLNKNNITFEKAAELYTNKTANRILFSYAKDSEISKRDRDYITQAVEQATASVNLAYAKEVVDLNTKNKHAKH